MDGLFVTKSKRILGFLLSVAKASVVVGVCWGSSMALAAEELLDEEILAMIRTRASNFEKPYVGTLSRREMTTQYFSWSSGKLKETQVARFKRE
ncbi:MAG: hypothetical protein ACI8Z1_001562 [Candidatus Azotimanducaceae bacterium]|jgi:hypothetical protein